MNENTEQNVELSPELEENLSLEELQQKVSQLKEELSAMENKASNHWDLLLRAKADEENLRKRSRIDLENAHKYGIEKFARSMLNVVDTLERGIESINVQDFDISVSGDLNLLNSLKDGMQLTLKLLLDSLEQFGVKMLNPSTGEAFNPIEHEALSTQDSLELPHNSIILVVQKGFIIYDRVLRPARVIVSKRS